MNRLTYKEYLSIAVLLAVIGVLGVIWQKPWQVGANVTACNSYLSTTTPTVADLTNLCPQRNSGVADLMTGTLGSIVVTGQNSGTLHIYDATTRDATLRIPAATSSLLLAELPTVLIGNASTTGTLTFDSEFSRGLLVDVVGSVSTTTITYRCEG